jgi:hypothetical protein
VYTWIRGARGISVQNLYLPLANGGVMLECKCCKNRVFLETNEGDVNGAIDLVVVNPLRNTEIRITMEYKQAKELVDMILDKMEKM